MVAATGCGGAESGGTSGVGGSAGLDGSVGDAKPDTAADVTADKVEAGGCVAPKKQCGDSCVDTAKDALNCGACGTACAAGEVCDAGKCALFCSGGTTTCGTSCVDIKKDHDNNANCGGCGSSCASGQICQNGACTLTCQSGLTNCSNQCVNLQNNNANCGACGNACAGNQACVGGGCVALAGCDWNIATLPLPINIHPNNLFGDIGFDANCDLLVTGGFNMNLYRVSRTTGAVSTLATGFSGSGAVTGVVYRPADGLIYVATDMSAKLWRLDVGGVQTQLATFGSPLNAIALAPAGFGAFAGQIVACLQNGVIQAVNPTNNAVTTVGTIVGSCSDIAFNPTGSLAYIANYDSGRIDTMTSTGTVTTFFSGLSSPDGLAMTPDGTRLFVVNNLRFDQITVPGGVLTQGLSVSLDGGYYTTGLILDASGDLIYKSSNGGTAQIKAYKP